MQDEEFRDALYIYALDAGRFDMTYRLIKRGYTARRELASRDDLTPRGREHYDCLASLMSDIAPCQDVATKYAAASLRATVAPTAPRTPALAL